MKKIFLATTAAIFLLGCGSKNAFEKLNLSQNQEKAIENTRSVKIASKESIGGVVSVVYLNNVDNTLDNAEHHFYISFYTKEDLGELAITLNNTPPLRREKLLLKNPFSELTLSKNEWNDSELVTFARDDLNDTRELTLLIGNDQFSSGQLKFLEALR